MSDAVSVVLVTDHGTVYHYAQVEGVFNADKGVRVERGDQIAATPYPRSMPVLAPESGVLWLTQAWLASTSRSRRTRRWWQWW